MTARQSISTGVVEFSTSREKHAWNSRAVALRRIRLSQRGTEGGRIAPPPFLASQECPGANIRCFRHRVLLRPEIVRFESCCGGARMSPFFLKVAGRRPTS